MMLVTPTLKAARSAQAETGAEAGSAAWLAYEHGYRWNNDGAWTRLQMGEADPVTGQPYRGPSSKAQLRAGDLLVVDEAGMLDQDTARALLHIADQAKARVALIGDPHQLPAVGRGGVLHLASRATSCACSLEVVHRFTTTTEIAPGIKGTVTDTAYADLSLRMRTGETPGGVFDALHARGLVALYADDTARTEAVAELAAQAWRTGERYALAADTRVQVADLSAAVRQRLVAAGQVDDSTVVVTSAGERIGAGDRIATRSNNHDLGVANRDTWRVEEVGEDGSLTLSHSELGTRTLDAEYARRHTELAYASTVFGVQGETVSSGHVVLGEATNAAAVYVGMTRGRAANTVHIVAGTLADARAQWIDAARRDRADLGLHTAREQAEQAASQYATTEALTRQRDKLAVRLHNAWTTQAVLQRTVEDLQDSVERARANRGHDAHLDEMLDQRRATAQAAQQRAAELTDAAQHARTVLAERARQIEARLVQAWQADQPALREAYATLYGPQPKNGALSRLSGTAKRREVERDYARRVITEWKHRWGADAPTHTTDPAHFLRPHAEQQARAQLPDAVEAITAAENAAENARQVVKEDRETRQAVEAFRLASVIQSGRHPARHLGAYEAELAEADANLRVINERIAMLTSHPLTSENWLDQQRQQWTTDHERQARELARQQAHQAAATRRSEEAAAVYHQDHVHAHDSGYGIGD